MVLGEQHLPGGQVYRSIEGIGPDVMNILGPDYQGGKNLVQRFRGASVEYMPGATVWQEADGVTERMVGDVPAGTSCCLAVWKVDAGEIAKEGSYSLWVAAGVSGVEDPVGALPKVTGITGATPNPFNPQTTIEFELAQDGPCELALYDLQGRLVRTLIAEHRQAGPNAAIWNGLDDRGRRAASGVYLARLRAGVETDLLKVTLVK